MRLRAKPTQLKTVETFQSIFLRIIPPASWYVSNHTLHKILHTESVETLVETHFKKFHSKLHQHPNPLISNQRTAKVLDNPPPPGRLQCRLKRHCCLDLLNVVIRN